MQPRQVSVSVQEEVNRAVIALSLIKHFKNFLWKGVALLLSLTCLLPSPVTQKKQRTKALQKTNSFCSASIYIRCWNPQPSLPDTSGKCISSTRPIMHHHGGVGGRVGTDRRIIILRGRKKLRGSLTAKYIFSYFRSLCNSRSMKKAEEGDTGGCGGLWTGWGYWQLKDRAAAGSAVSTKHPVAGGLSGARSVTCGSMPLLFCAVSLHTSKMAEKMLMRHCLNFLYS